MTLRASLLRFLAGLFLLAASVASQAQSSTTPLDGRVAMHLGRPQLFVSGKPTLPVFYALTDSPAGRWTWEEVPQWNLRRFADIGVKQFCVSIWLEWIWTAPDKLDLDLVRRQIRGVLEACPDAAVMIRLHVNSPPWWNEQHPDELVRYADGPVEAIQPWGMVRPLEGDLERTPRHSMASQRWRADSGAIVAKLCRELAATPEGDHLVALHLAAGVFHEWHYYGFIDHEPDVGLAMTERFRTWLREKYPTDEALRTAWHDPAVTRANATVPRMAERHQTSDGYFRDPQRERRVIDYYECHQLSVAESIEHFCRIAKENWPRPLVTGAFYGYYFTLFGRMATGGHLQIERLLNSPWIDYLSGPQSYRHRDVGCAGFSRGLLESVRLHGKLWLDEYDTRPGLGAQADPDPDRELANMVGVERRCFSEPLLRGQGFWFYDFGLRTGHGNWDRPALLREAQDMKVLFGQRLAKPFESGADVLLVMSNEVFYFLGNSRKTDPVTPVAIDDFTEDLFHTGAAVDMIYPFDLERVDLARYRAVILPNAYYLTAKQREFIRTRVMRDGRTVIFMSAPGYTDGERLNVDFVGEVTGMTVQRAPTGTAANVTVSAAGIPKSSYGFGSQSIEPLFAVHDAAAESAGMITGTSLVGLARRQTRDATTWFSSVPLRGPALIRSLLKSAGVHLYQESGDVTYAGNGMILLHTLAGGERTVALRNGRSVALTLPPKSTVLLDAESGERLLEEREYRVPRGSRN